ncbi:amino acid ABC transporter permease [Agrobacterium sp. LAD9]|uniref:amino acid ABC transporter permease n=1 Tax=Agrobacterium sp. LAD9 TaxID=2055153 RepID=UPI000D1ED1F1|nr:amino acid ABC transporter permease [Agrobacterium sp. LAD9]
MIEILSDYGPFLLFGDYHRGILGGLALTLLIAAVSLALTFPFALTVALMRTSGRKWLSRPAACFVYGVRGIPLLMLILWIYFFLPVVAGDILSPFSTIVVALVIFQAAYLSEVFRAGIEAISPGQSEAGLALGLRRPVILLKIILPQALVNVIPGIISQFTMIIKETSLGYVIALHELTFSAAQVSGTLMTRPMEVYLILAAIYFVVCFTMSSCARFIERRIALRRSGGGQAMTQTIARAGA